MDLAHWAWLLQTSPSSSVQNLNLQCKWYAVCSAASVMSGSLQPRGPYPTRLLCPWDFSGRDTGLVAISFSRGSSQPRDRTRVSYISCTADRFFTAKPPGIALCKYFLFLQVAALFHDRAMPFTCNFPSYLQHFHVGIFLETLQFL